MTYVKINEETSRYFTAPAKTKLCHNTTLEQYEDIIKDAKQQCMVRTIKRSQPTRGGTVWQQQMPANRDQHLS